MSQLIEIWKSIKDFPDYSVSNLGKVKRIKSCTASRARVGKILKPGLDGDGYLLVVLWKNGKGKTQKVHHLVLKAFVGNPPPFHECNHKDGITQNNWVENLEWVTKSENALHSIRMGLRKVFKNGNLKGEHHPSSRLKEGEVWLIRTLYDNKNPKVNRDLMSKMFKVHKSYIQAIGRRLAWTHI
jgi:hypothetical protein